jgi:hypothetical protein
MNYYLDTEFIEDFTPPCLVIPGFKKEKPKHYIDLISIGLVSEDDREYYAVSKDFNLKHVWNKYDTEWSGQLGEEPIKVYWLRENVLRPLWLHLRKQISAGQKYYTSSWETFTYSHLKQLIAQFGKSNKQIAKEIEDFTGQVKFRGLLKENPDPVDTPVFYGYYADYDWVLFCSLFGRMLDLPKGYPMFCFDLKQSMQELGLTKEWKEKHVPDNNIHHALLDARWNQQLHKEIVRHQKTLTVHG